MLCVFIALCDAFPVVVTKKTFCEVKSQKSHKLQTKNVHQNFQFCVNKQFRAGSHVTSIDYTFCKQNWFFLSQKKNGDLRTEPNHLKEIGSMDLYLKFFGKYLKNVLYISFIFIGVIPKPK